VERMERVDHLGILVDLKRLVLTDVLSEAPCSVQVTAKQARLMATFLSHPRDVLTRDRLRDAIGIPASVRTNAVKSHLCRLAQLIRDEGGAEWTARLQFWRSVRRAGYCVSEDWAATRLLESAGLLACNLSAEALRARAGHLDEPQAAMMLGHLGVTATKHGRFEQAFAYHQGALYIHMQLGDMAGQARTYEDLGTVLSRQGNSDDREREKQYYERSIVIKRQIGDRVGLARTLRTLAGAEATFGEDDAAVGHLRARWAVGSGLGEGHAREE
jgi:DNA-binding winged helix-turn-helix (wHTH) protein